jgi:uncharacterized membrane protein
MTAVTRARRTPERLSAFSDAVFAVLITVLVLELRPPELPTFKALLSLWPTWLSYAVSYLFIAIVWANHHHLMRYAIEVTPRLMWFNLAHLFSVSLLPLSTAWMAVSHSMCFRGGCACDVEIPADWARNVLLLSDRLSKTRSTRAREVTISQSRGPTPR